MHDNCSGVPRDTNGLTAQEFLEELFGSQACTHCFRDHTHHTAQLGVGGQWQAVCNKRTEWTESEIREFIDAYVDCALDDENDHLRDELGDDAPDNLVDAMDEASLESMRGQAREFANANMADLAGWFSPDYAGDDLWYTRNGHGVGYWVRALASDTSLRFSTWAVAHAHDPSAQSRLEEATTRLTNAAKACGESDLYVGDDGRIYVSPINEQAES